jgi:hypothetical protein
MPRIRREAGQARGFFQNQAGHPESERGAPVEMPPLGMAGRCSEVLPRKVAEVLSRRLDDGIISGGRMRARLDVERGVNAQRPDRRATEALGLWTVGF